MTKERLDILLEKYSKNTCNQQELQELYQWYENYGDRNATELPPFIANKKKEYLGEKYSEIKYRLNQAKIKKIRILRRTIAVAALIVLAVGIGWIWKTNEETPSSQLTINQNDIQPGQSGAILTLSDGSRVQLDSAANTNIVQAGNSNIRNFDGQLVYNTGDASVAQVAFNTLSTPRGRQYHLVLPDGSKVFLNAASSIKYPVSFNQNERRVEITGEVYFEVVHNDAQPFKVAVGDFEIEDLGTIFNVNAYENEPIVSATLLEGAIKVKGRLLTPGEQAQVAPDQTMQIVSLSNTENVVAWKNGLMMFDGTDLTTLFRQIERWYNIDVKIEGNLPDIYLTGTLPRNMKLSSVLEIFELNKIKCSLHGKELIVTAD